jgi:hypothetical protein
MHLPNSSLRRPCLLILSLCLLAASPLTFCKAEPEPAAAAELAATTLAVAPPRTPSHCAPTYHSCSSPSFPSVGGVCCPSSSVCQIGAHGPRCVEKKEVNECEACCKEGRCTVAAPSQKDESGIMQPQFTSIQCCGVSAGSSFCCPVRSKAVGDVPSKAQRCEAAREAWDCVDAPASIMSMSVSLAVWQLALCVVGGVLFCGALGGGGHRAYGSEIKQIPAPSS